MTTTPTSGAADLLAMVSKALREAYNLGQRYWQQADSEYISQHKKADDTRAKFLALVEETCAALAAGQATAAAQPVVPAEWPTNEMIDAGRKAAASQGRLLGSGQSLWHVFRAMLAAAPAQPAAQQGAAYAVLPEYGINTASHAHFRVLGFTADQMRAFADATHMLRASHGQASSQAGEPTEQQILEAAFAPAQPAVEASRFGSPALQAMIIARCVEKDRAASVQEDAVRYRWLRRWKGQEHEPPFTVQHEIDGTLWGGDLDAAIDTARKQGANHN